MRRVAQHEAEQSGQGPVTVGQSRHRTSGLTGQEERGHELGRGEQGRGQEGEQARANAGSARARHQHVADHEAAGDERRSRACRFRRAGEEEKGEADGEAGRARGSPQPHVVLRGQQHERQQRGRHQGRRVREMRDQVRAEREAEPAHERADALRAQAPQIKEDEDGGRGERDEDEGLEGGEGRKQRQEGHERMERARPIGREQRRAQEYGRVPFRKLPAGVALPDERAQREVQGRAVSGAEEAMRRPGRGIGHRRQRGQEEQQPYVPSRPAENHALSLPAAICSEMRPNRNTTTASWISSADPIGILPCTTTFQIP